MRGGQLRKRIEVQAPDRATASNDSHGNPVRAWRLLRTVWGKIEPIKGIENWKGMAVSSQITHGITIRYFKDLTPDCRFKYAPPGASGARIFHIQGILNKDERSVTHHITCIEGDPSG